MRTASSTSQRVKRVVENVAPYAEAVTRAAAGAALLKTGDYVKKRRRAVKEALPELRTSGVFIPLCPRGPLSLALVRKFRVSASEPVPEVAWEEVTMAPETSPDTVTGFLYRPEKTPSGTALPAILWIHGGGTIAGLAAGDHDYASSLARDLGVVVLNVDYRLAPEHPFPLPFEDCYTALLWLHENAKRLGIDTERIVVAGMSAGGLLAAAVAQRAADEGVPVCFQALLYPMLDDRTVLFHPMGRGSLVWTPEANRYAWEAYLRRVPGTDETRPYAVPARRPDLSGLAPAWIGVGDLDLFYTEDVEYASRLQASGVDCELYTVPGMYHAAEIKRPKTTAARAFTLSLHTAIRAAIGR
jgi:acetyl esterase/lipase